MSLEIGALVVSANGRDTGTVLAVIGRTDTHLILANGRKRRIEKPKLKKIKHVKKLDAELEGETVSKLIKGELTNKMLYKGIWRSLNNEKV